MGISFAAIESSINAACIGALSNADIILPSGGRIIGIFSNGYATSLDTGGSDPSVTVKSSEVTELVYGATLTIDAVAWKVQRIEPDGTGMTVIGLIRA